MQLTSATKTAFLNQVSMLITPLLVYASGHEVRFVEWLACGLGLLGSGALTCTKMELGYLVTMDAWRLRVSMLSA